MSGKLNPLFLFQNFAEIKNLGHQNSPVCLDLESFTHGISILFHKASRIYTRQHVKTGTKLLVSQHPILVPARKELLQTVWRNVWVPKIYLCLTHKWAWFRTWFFALHCVWISSECNLWNLTWWMRCKIVFAKPLDLCADTHPKTIMDHTTLYDVT